MTNQKVVFKTWQQQCQLYRLHLYQNIVLKLLVILSIEIANFKNFRKPQTLAATHGGFD